MRAFKNLTLFISLTIMISIKVSSQEVTKVHKDSLDAIITKYYALHTKMFQAGSTVEHVDKAFALFTDDFTYTHTKFDGYYTLKSLYESALKNLRNGSYNGRVLGYNINNKIIGLNAATIQKRFVEKKDGAIVESELQMTLFEFKKGKISRIVEYW